MSFFENRNEEKTKEEKKNTSNVKDVKDVKESARAGINSKSSILELSILPTNPSHLITIYKSKQRLTCQHVQRR